MQQHEGDDLLRTIRAYVTETVPPPLVDVITELVARTVVTIMTTPSFYLHLTYVQELQREILRLQTILASRQTPRKRPPSPSKASSPTKRPAPQKRAPVAPPRVKKAAPRARTRTGQFKKGSSGR